MPGLISWCRVKLRTSKERKRDNHKMKHNLKSHRVDFPSEKTTKETWYNLQFAMIMDGFLAALINSVIDLHDSSLVSATVTVVRCGKYCDDTSIMLPLVPLHHKLMRSWNKEKAINMGKLFRNVLPKRVSCTPRRDAPTTSLNRR